MTEKSIRADIVEAIEGVNHAGKVYDHIPWSSTWDVHLDKFKTRINGYVNAFRGFTVSLTSMTQTGEILTTDTERAVRAYQYAIRGYHAISEDDDSENDFLEVVLDVITALDGLNISSYPRPLAQLEYNPAEVGGVLCHVAEITMDDIREQVDC